MSDNIIRPTFGKKVVHTDEYFGGCPQCGQNDGYVNFGREHHFVCHEHKVRWCVGSNLFSSWQNEEQGPEEIARLWKVRRYQEVKPIYPPRDDTAAGAW